MKIRNIGTNLPTSEYIDKVSPVDKSVIYQIPLSRETEITDVFNNTLIATNALIDAGIFARTLMLDQVIHNLIQRRSEIVNLVIKETGKPRKLSENEFDTAILFGQSLIGLARFQDGITIPSASSRKLVYEKRIPYGVAGLIVSYNTPLPNYAWKVFPSFLAGNASILKPSPHTSGSAQLFVEAFENESLPNHSLCLLHGDALTGEILCNEDLNLMSFTGSYDVGLKIQINTATKMRKNIFELGGNNCLIINKSSNLDLAVDAVINSAFSNSGQRCAAGSRVLVNRDIYAKTLDMITNKLSLIRVGSDDEAYLGPVIDELAAKRYKDFLKDCAKNNLKITKNDNNSRNNELYVDPVIIEGFDTNNLLFKKEVFTPILRVASFETKEEALALANNSNYELTSAIWSNEIEEIDFYVKNLKAGLVNVNGPTHGSEFQFPFGGIGYSGNGAKEVGIQCLDQYSHRKLVTMNSNV